MMTAREYSTGAFRLQVNEVKAGMEFEANGHTYEVLQADLVGYKYYLLEVRRDRKRKVYMAHAQARPARCVS